MLGAEAETCKEAGLWLVDELVIPAAERLPGDAEKLLARFKFADVAPCEEEA